VTADDYRPTANAHAWHRSLLPGLSEHRSSRVNRIARTASCSRVTSPCWRIRVRDYETRRVSCTCCRETIRSASIDEPLDIRRISVTRLQRRADCKQPAAGGRGEAASRSINSRVTLGSPELSDHARWCVNDLIVTLLTVFSALGTKQTWPTSDNESVDNELFIKHGITAGFIHYACSSKDVYFPSRHVSGRFINTVARIRTEDEVSWSPPCFDDATASWEVLIVSVNFPSIRERDWRRGSKTVTGNVINCEARYDTSKLCVLQRKGKRERERTCKRYIYNVNS